MLSSSADFLKIAHFRRMPSGLPSGRQTDRIQIRPDVLSDLIWVQTVYKGYQQTTLSCKKLTPNEVAAELFSL